MEFEKQLQFYLKHLENDYFICVEQYNNFIKRMKRELQRTYYRGKVKKMTMFDYIKYDESAVMRQDYIKKAAINLENEIRQLGNGRYKSLALTALEECYAWTGKAIRDEQIERNGGFQLTEDRNNS